MIGIGEGVMEGVDGVRLGMVVTVTARAGAVVLQAAQEIMTRITEVIVRICFDIVINKVYGPAIINTTAESHIGVSFCHNDIVLGFIYSPSLVVNRVASAPCSTFILPCGENFV